MSPHDATADLLLPRLQALATDRGDLAALHAVTAALDPMFRVRATRRPRPSLTPPVNAK